MANNNLTFTCAKLNSSLSHSLLPSRPPFPSRENFPIVCSHSTKPLSFIALTCAILNLFVWLWFMSVSQIDCHLLKDQHLGYCFSLLYPQYLAQSIKEIKKKIIYRYKCFKGQIRWNVYRSNPFQVNQQYSSEIDYVYSGDATYLI